MPRGSTKGMTCTKWEKKEPKVKKSFFDRYAMWIAQDKMPKKYRGMDVSAAYAKYMHDKKVRGFKKDYRF